MVKGRVHKFGYGHKFECLSGKILNPLSLL
jgi:hypothetical protein